MGTKRELLRRWASQGRAGDTKLVHATRGDVVIPVEIQTPQVNEALKFLFTAANTNKERFTVGAKGAQKNPDTGLPEFQAIQVGTGLETLTRPLGVNVAKPAPVTGPTGAGASPSALGTPTPPAPATGEAFNDLIKRAAQPEGAPGTAPGGEATSIGTPGTTLDTAMQGLAKGIPGLMGLALGPVAPVASLASLALMASDPKSLTNQALNSLFGFDLASILGSSGSSPSADALGQLGSIAGANAAAFGPGAATPGGLSAADLGAVLGGSADTGTAGGTGPAGLAGGGEVGPVGAGADFGGGFGSSTGGVGGDTGTGGGGGGGVGADSGGLGAGGGFGGGGAM